MDINSNDLNDNNKEIISNEKNHNDKKIKSDSRFSDNKEETILYKKDNSDKKNMSNIGGCRNFFTSSLAAMLMIFIFAVASVVSYLPIRNIYFPAEDNVKNYIEDAGIGGTAYDIARLTQHLQRFVNQTDSWADGRYINVESIKYKIYPLKNNEDSKQTQKSDIDKGKNEADVENNSEVAGTADDKATDKAVGETDETVKDTDIEVQKRSLTNMPHISDSELQAEIDNSLLYIKINFDENGHPTIKTVLGDKLRKQKARFDKNFVISYLKDGQGEQAERYANLEAIYIIPQDFESYNDVLTLNMKEKYVFPNYSTLILAIGAISILILIIAAFAIPYSLQSQATVCRGFNKMPLELKPAVWILFMALLGINVAALDGLSHGYSYINPVIKMAYDVDPYFYIIGIPLTFILYLLIYLGTVYIKHIYHTGFKEGFINNSLIGKAMLYLAGNTKGILKRVMTIDLKEDNQRKLIGIAVMNFLVIMILGSGGFLGFILAAIYSIIVFKYMLGLIESAAELNRASSQVAGGNFDIKVNEDMGMLTPMAKNLNNIKQGFSLAVDKEIKSERMKSELISNVSHDLKTPLTSIITYVDLLKNEKVELDTQKKYIDIISQKSQRLKILIEDLFEASKATSGNVDLNLENIDVIALFRQTLGELEEKINESSLQFRTNVPENKVICNLDGKRTYRIFENIISNILKYSMKNSRVYIDVIENEKNIEFIFKNISSYEMNFDPSEITDRLTRGDESRSTEGSGLGLSIAKSLVELQGGNLDIIIDGDLFKLTVAFPKI
ncbi:MAG TPA: HAMP domain-containing sensor histidine kinase [Oscillospiraceae bacterium]|nr:HAMP domain-containing sensor histidine kinase [Oscillospiraceae bacterium]